MRLAFEGEVEVEIKVGGIPLQTFHGDYSVSLDDLASRTPHKTKKNDETTIISSRAHNDPSMLYCTSSSTQCRNILIKDGFKYSDLDESDGEIWNGVYTLTITRPDSTECDYEIVQNHKDTDSDTFFNVTARDQKLSLNFSSSGGCAAAVWTDKHPKPSSELSVSISAPDTVFKDSTFTVSASASGGFGTYRYIKNFNADDPDSVDFSGTFSTTNAWNHSYNTTGAKIVAVVVKDQGSVGGNYHLASRTIVVDVPGSDNDADAVSHTLGLAMCTNEIQLVSFEMKNTGETTWTTSNSYGLDLHRDSGWLPLSDPVSTSVSPNSEHQFVFNLQAPEHSATYDCFYRMNSNVSGFFGEENGKTMQVVDCGGFSASMISDPSMLATDPASSWTKGGAETTIYPLRLRFSAVSPNIGIFQYGYSMSKEHSIDTVLKIAFDPQQLRPAALVPGGGARNAVIDHGIWKSGEYWVRIRGRLSPGSNALFQIPFVRLVEEDRKNWGTVIFYH